MTLHTEHSQTPVEMLTWFNAMGVDEIMLDTPINRLETPPQQTPERVIEIPIPQATTPLSPTKVPTSASLSPVDAIKSARELANNCTSLDELKTILDDIDFISIKKTAMNTVLADGDPESSVMFIGEAPGAEEDKQGTPFCGPSGRLLDKAISHIDLNRKSNCYITNSVFWRPPGNRRPTPEELLICQPFVERHIALINPTLIILVGGTATAAVLQEKTGITKLRGKYTTYTNPYLKHSIDVTAVFHPSYLLRQPDRKKLFWQDLQRISAFLKKQHSPKKP